MRDTFLVTPMSRYVACPWDYGRVECERHGREVHHRLVDGVGAPMRETGGLLELRLEAAA
jgi:hypothetical protein